MTDGQEVPSAPSRDWRLFVPKSITVLQQDGYGWPDFRADLIAGATVAIVALPPAIAIAIASGATPGVGLTLVKRSSSLHLEVRGDTEMGFAFGG